MYRKLCDRNQEVLNMYELISALLQPNEVDPLVTLIYRFIFYTFYICASMRHREVT